MGGSADVPATVANPRHAELAQALAHAKSAQGPTDNRLQAVESAMTGHAWTGGTSDAFFGELRANIRNLHTATQGCIDNVATALSNCPATLPNPAAKKS